MSGMRVFVPNRTADTEANATIISSDVVSLNEPPDQFFKSRIPETAPYEIFSKDSLLHKRCRGRLGVNLAHNERRRFPPLNSV